MKMDININNHRYGECWVLCYCYAMLYEARCKSEEFFFYLRGTKWHPQDQRKDSSKELNEEASRSPLGNRGLAGYLRCEPPLQKHSTETEERRQLGERDCESEDDNITSTTYIV